MWLCENVCSASPDEASQILLHAKVSVCSNCQSDKAQETHAEKSALPVAALEAS